MPVISGWCDMPVGIMCKMSKLFVYYCETTYTIVLMIIRCCGIPLGNRVVLCYRVVLLHIFAPY